MMTSSHENVFGTFEDLPPKEKQRLLKLFKQLDVDSDGKISSEDLAVAFKQMGIPYQPEGCIQSRVDKKGSLNFKDFFHFIQESEQQLMALFKYMDANRDGIIDAEEIVGAFQRFGVRIDKQEAFVLLKRIDKDDSQTISFNEWRDYLLFLPSFELHEILRSWRHATFLDLGENVLVPEDFTKAEMQTGAWWRHLVAGGIAGIVSRTCTAPLDRVKVFVQVKATEHSGIYASAKSMYREGGMFSLWRGNGINILKIAPESALKFMAYEQIKRLIKGDADRELTVYERFIAGAFAGGIAQSTIYPMEVLKTRLVLRKTGQYKGLTDAACKIFKQEGIRSFYRGYVPNLLGILPYAGIDLAIYETLKQNYILKHPKDHQPPNWLVLLGCGAISSSCGQMASYPLSLVRTRLQAQGLANNTSGATMRAVFKNILKKEGITGLYRGLKPNFIKVIPSVGISYIVYERAKVYLNVKAI